MNSSILQTRPVAASARKRRRFGSGAMLAFALVLPGVLLAVLFKLVPLIHAFWLSLLRTRGFEDPTFAGLRNYYSAFRDPAVGQAFRNAVMVFLTLPLWIFLPLIIALLLF